jgi:putative nucleotidyltransferase with HDIG domain
LYDLVSSSLAIVLAFLYIKFQIVGLAVLVLPLFFVRHMYQMNLQVERVNRELLELMVKAIEARDPYTSGHSVRVAEYARQIARELGLTPKHVDQIGTAALLHDVGKIHEDFAPLLRKAGRLTPEERMLMQAHPVRSADLAGTIAEFRGRVHADIRNHHENYDGTGYPDGLIGEGIPIGARIIMIADTIDAMTTDRPYRKALSLSKALEEMSKHAGRQFDPKLVELVSKSPSIRRLLGPQLVSGPSIVPSMQAPSRTVRPRGETVA